jgi:hypothetical protein
MSIFGLRFFGSSGCQWLSVSHSTIRSSVLRFFGEPFSDRKPNPPHPVILLAALLIAEKLLPNSGVDLPARIVLAHGHFNCFCRQPLEIALLRFRGAPKRTVASGQPRSFAKVFCIIWVSAFQRDEEARWFPTAICQTFSHQTQVIVGNGIPC